MPELVEEFFARIRQKDAAAVEKLLQERPEFAAARDGAGASAISFAMYSQAPEIAAMLARRKGSLDLFEASTIGDVDRVRQLLDSEKESIDQFSLDGYTPLSLAAFFGHPEVVDLLLQRGARVDLQAENPMKVAPIHAAAARGDALIVMALIDAGADINATQRTGATALHSAAGAGDARLVQLLLDNGADPNVRLDDGRTPADVARDRGHPSIAELFES